NYTHFEEQYVNNPNAKIIIDYGVKFSTTDYFKDPSILKKKVATYLLAYGKGKVIVTGLSARLLVDDEQFIRFFENGILPNALCTKFLSCKLNKPENDFTPPSINITDPSYPPTTTTGRILIEGTANDLN